MVPNNQHLCFKSLCDAPDFEPLKSGEVLKGHLRDIYAGWRTDLDDPMTGAQLLQEILRDSAEGMDGGILVFVGQRNNVKARLIHNLREHSVRSSEHRGTVFAYVGDVSSLDIETIKFNTDMLTKIDEGLRCALTLEAHAAELASQPEGQLARYPGDDDDTSKEYFTRKAMYVPYSMVSLLLDGPPMGPREVFETLTPVIEQLGLNEICLPLTEFLMVATTKGSRDAATSPVYHTNAGVPTTNLADVQSSRREKILYTMLPALKAAATGGDPTLPHLLGSMREIRDGILQDIGERRLARAETQKAMARPTIISKWSDTPILGRLLKMVNVQDASSDDIPKIYSQLAAHKKADGPVRLLLQDAVNAAAEALRISMPPTVSVQHATALTSWVFHGATENALGEGLMPFTVVPPNQTSRAALAAIETTHGENMDLNTVTMGSTTITAADAQKMRTSKAYLPANFEEMLVQLRAYSCLLGAILGPKHPNVVEHQAAVDSLVMNQALLKQMVTAKYGGPLGASVIVHYFQLRHRNWFRRQWMITTTVTLPPPKLLEGIEHFADSHTLTWLPNIDHIDDLRKLIQVPAPTALTNNGRSGNGNAGAGTGNGGASAGDGGSMPRERVTNRNRDSRVYGETPLARRIQAKSVKEALKTMGDVCLPASDGGDRCLSWHIKGKCYNDCKRVSDHIVLSLEERDTLIKWCEQAF